MSEEPIEWVYNEVDGEKASQVATAILVVLRQVEPRMGLLCLTAAVHGWCHLLGQDASEVLAWMDDEAHRHNFRVKWGSKREGDA